MTNDLRYDLQQHGFLARRSELTRLGHTDADLDRRLRDGRLVRPIRGWVATTQAPRDAVIALIHRGVLTGASALRALDIWAGTDLDIHVRVPPNMPNTRAKALTPIAAFAPSVSSGQVVRHWSPARFESQLAWRSSAADALIAFARRESAEFAVAAIESALHTEALRPRDLPLLLDCLPRSLTPYFALIDGRSESGTETLARLRLASLSNRIDIQVRVGPHRLDILIDGWLNVEIDSEAWHGGERLANSRRDTWLVGRGYVVLRFDYFEVMHEWEACAAAVFATLRDPARAQQPVR
jgi:very-short-patch-repair endonuclease